MNKDHVGIDVTVAHKVAEAVDICSLSLQLPDGGELPPFEAGAHIEVMLANGLKRHYSLVNDPADRSQYFIGVLREPKSRGGSVAMHALQPGDLVRITAPRNNFRLDWSATHHILLGGGIGVTPLLSMASQLERAGASFELHYCTRCAERTAFRHRIGHAPYARRAFIHHDDGPPGQRLDLAAVFQAAPPQAHIYVCGPGGFIDWTLAQARAAHIGEAALHREHFTQDTPIHRQNDGSFELRLERTGLSLRVGADQSVVEAAAAAGVDIPTSCNQGICGTCLTGVIAGVPDHRDLFLTPAEQAANNQFLPCCSRSKTPQLVIDL
jgi:vanillate O-demethylase ferredoxin subunit